MRAGVIIDSDWTVHWDKENTSSERIQYDRDSVNLPIVLLGIVTLSVCVTNEEAPPALDNSGLRIRQPFAQLLQ